MTVRTVVIGFVGCACLGSRARAIKSVNATQLLQIPFGLGITICNPEGTHGSILMDDRGRGVWTVWYKYKLTNGDVNLRAYATGRLENHVC
jgi:hypothetical protein